MDTRYNRKPLYRGITIRRIMIIIGIMSCLVLLTLEIQRGILALKHAESHKWWAAYWEYESAFFAKYTKDADLVKRLRERKHRHEELAKKYHQRAFRPWVNDPIHPVMPELPLVIGLPLHAPKFIED